MCCCWLLLSATSIGRVVNKLKKVEDAAVAELGKKLVKEWKALVEDKYIESNLGRKVSGRKDRIEIRKR